VDDPILVAIAHYVMANDLYLAGEFAPSCQHFEQSLSVYEAHGRPSVVSLMGEELAVVCRSFGCYALGPSGYPERALRWAEEALHLARELRSPYDLALALGVAAWLHPLRGEPQLTRERAEAVITVAAEQGFPGLAANASVLLGWALVQQNHPEDGIRQMLGGIETSVEQGYMTDYQLPLLADAYRTIGQGEAGLRSLNEARELLNKTGIRYSEAELYRLEGELLMQNGTNEAQAENCFRRAIEVAQRQSAKSWELRATTSLARLLAKEARPAEVRAMLAEIYNWFTEGFDLPDLKGAKALLDELAG
jgi:predicted ATPase